MMPLYQIQFIPEKIKIKQSRDYIRKSNNQAAFIPEKHKR